MRALREKHLLTSSNPFNDPALRQRNAEMARMRGKAHLTGGNGRGMSQPQTLLLQRLGWTPEHVVGTGSRGKGMPTHYKIDIACPERKIAIEVDGRGHRSMKVKAADARKESFLRSLGWTVLRFQNQRVMDELDAVVAEIMTASKSST